MIFLLLGLGCVVCGLHAFRGCRVVSSCGGMISKVRVGKGVID